MLRNVIFVKSENVEDVARQLIEFLSDSSFSVVTSHSYFGSVSVQVDCSLKDDLFEVKGSMVVIKLNPKRVIAFDLSEQPKISFESERVVRIERNISQSDTLTKIILIDKSEVDFDKSCSVYPKGWW